MIPDRAVVAELRRIDPKLSVGFDPIVERWGVYHDAPLPHESQADIASIATEMMTDLWKRGIPCTRAVCEQAAFLKLKEAKLVFYVAEDDGRFRPLDHRVVEKLRKMNYQRENWEVRDWKLALNAMEDREKDYRKRVWDDFNKKAVGTKEREYMADALRGDPHIRSVDVTQPEKPARYPLAEVTAETKREETNEDHIGAT